MHFISIKPAWHTNGSGKYRRLVAGLLMEINLTGMHYALFEYNRLFSRKHPGAGPGGNGHSLFSY